MTTNIFRKSAIARFASMVLILLLLFVFAPQNAHAAAYNISSASFTQIALDVSGKEGNPMDMTFNDDGTTLYVMGYNTDDINEYTLSTPYDISSASFTQMALDVSGQESIPLDMTFNNDGTTLYVTGVDGDDINEYTLSTPYDISSASFTQIALDVSGQETSPSSLIFNNDGTTLYMMGQTGDDINEYTLSTPYDISSASFKEVVLDVSGQEITPVYMTFNDDGTTLYVMGTTGDDINEYTLSTPYDISSASFTQIALDVSGQESNPTSLLFNNDGTTLYVMGQTGDDIDEYNIDTTAPTVSLTAPSDGSTVSGSSVTISSDASDDTGVSGVKFYINGILQGSEDTSSPYSITWDSTATSSGEKSIEAVARDAANNIATSTATSITVDNTPTPSSLGESTSSSGATITWNTAKNGSSRVYFGVTSATSTSTSETNTGGNATTSHSVALSDLVSCTTYSYKTVSRNPSGLDTATSTESSFKTTGCTGSSSITSNSESSITTASGGTLTHSTLTLTVPTSFTNSSSALFQVNTLETSTFIATAGTPSGKNRAGSVYNLKSFTDDTTALSSFDKAITITFSYTDDDASGLNESSFKIHRYNDSSWSELSNCSVDASANTISCDTTQFSDFAIFGDASSSSPAGGFHYGCKDKNASNYEYFSAHKQELCEYEDPEETIKELKQRIAAIKMKINALNTSISNNSVSDSSSFYPKSADCTYTHDLDLGDFHDETRCLQKYLNANGFLVAETGPGSPGNETTYFGSLTKQALIQFQEAYADEILTPLGLQSGTGYFGPSTRKFIDSH